LRHVQVVKNQSLQSEVQTLARNITSMGSYDLQILALDVTYLHCGNLNKYTKDPSQRDGLIDQLPPALVHIFGATANGEEGSLTQALRESNHADPNCRVRFLDVTSVTFSPCFGTKQRKFQRAKKPFAVSLRALPTVIMDTVLLSMDLNNDDEFGDGGIPSLSIEYKFITFPDRAKLVTVKGKAGTIAFSAPLHKMRGVESAKLPKEWGPVNAFSPLVVDVVITLAASTPPPDAEAWLGSALTSFEEWRRQGGDSPVQKGDGEIDDGAKTSVASLGSVAVLRRVAKELEQEGDGGDGGDGGSRSSSSASASSSRSSSSAESDDSDDADEVGEVATEPSKASAKGFTPAPRAKAAAPLLPPATLTAPPVPAMGTKAKLPLTTSSLITPVTAAAALPVPPKASRNASKASDDTINSEGEETGQLPVSQLDRPKATAGGKSAFDYSDSDGESDGDKTFKAAASKAKAPLAAALMPALKQKVAPAAKPPTAAPKATAKKPALPAAIAPSTAKRQEPSPRSATASGLDLAVLPPSALDRRKNAAPNENAYNFDGCDSDDSADEAPLLLKCSKSTSNKADSKQAGTKAKTHPAKGATPGSKSTTPKPRPAAVTLGSGRGGMNDDSSDDSSESEYELTGQKKQQSVLEKKKVPSVTPGIATAAKAKSKIIIPKTPSRAIVALPVVGADRDHALKRLDKKTMTVLKEMLKRFTPGVTFRKKVKKSDLMVSQLCIYHVHVRASCSSRHTQPLHNVLIACCKPSLQPRQDSVIDTGKYDSTTDMWPDNINDWPSSDSDEEDVKDAHARNKGNGQSSVEVRTSGKDQVEVSVRKAALVSVLSVKRPHNDDDADPFAMDSSDDDHLPTTAARSHPPAAATTVKSKVYGGGKKAAAAAKVAMNKEAAAAKAAKASKEKKAAKDAAKERAKEAAKKAAKEAAVSSVAAVAAAAATTAKWEKTNKLKVSPPKREHAPKVETRLRAPSPVQKLIKQPARSASSSKASSKVNAAKASSSGFESEASDPISTSQDSQDSLLDNDDFDTGAGGMSVDEDELEDPSKRLDFSGVKPSASTAAAKELSAKVPTVTPALAPARAAAASSASLSSLVAPTAKLPLKAAAKPTAVPPKVDLKSAAFKPAAPPAVKPTRMPAAAMPVAQPATKLAAVKPAAKSAPKAALKTTPATEPKKRAAFGKQADDSNDSDADSVPSPGGASGRWPSYRAAASPAESLASASSVADESDAEEEDGEEDHDGSDSGSVDSDDSDSSEESNDDGDDEGPDSTLMLLITNMVQKCPGSYFFLAARDTCIELLKVATLSSKL